MIEQGLWNVPRAEYHADDTCLCNSALTDFATSVPLFYFRHIARTLAPREATDAMSLGTALHTLALEPEKFDREFAIWCGLDKRTKEGKAAWAEFAESSKGKTVITQEQLEAARRMADAIRSHSLARPVIEDAGMVEQAIRWHDDESGLWVRNLMDKWSPNLAIVADIKTSSDPSPGAFAKSVANFNYHRQAALYSRGAQAVFGKPVDFMFIVVGSQEPHEVACYLLDKAAIELGDRLNQSDLAEIAERKRSGQWASRYADKIQILNLPKWVSYQ